MRLLAALDLDALGLIGRRLWQDEPEHAMLEGGVNLVCVHLHGQRQRPDKLPAGQFPNQVVAFLLTLGLVYFTLNRKSVALQRNVHVSRIYTRQRRI